MGASVRQSVAGSLPIPEDGSAKQEEAAGGGAALSQQESGDAAGLQVETATPSRPQQPRPARLDERAGATSPARRLVLAE